MWHRYIRNTWKAIKKRQSKNPPPDVIITPDELKKKYKRVRLFSDVIHIKKLVFLHAMSEKIELRTSSFLQTE